MRLVTHAATAPPNGTMRYRQIEDGVAFTRRLSPSHFAGLISAITCWRTRPAMMGEGLAIRPLGAAWA